MRYLIKNKFWNFNKEYNKEKLLYLLVDRPDKIDIYNDFIWKNNKDQVHRDYDFPAVVWNDGTTAWFKNDKCHRENNKPAYVYNNGYKEYWLNGKRIK